MLLALLACHGPDAPSPRQALARSSAREALALTVDCKGGGHFDNLRDAIAAARSGDHIAVAPCTYYGSIDFDGKALRIESTGGAAVTTIRATPGSPVVKVSHGEGSGTLLAGFTLEGGGGALEPAIDNEFSVLTIRDSVITGSVGNNVVYGRSPHLVLERVTISGNTASEGVLIRSRRGSIVVKDSEISCDGASVGYTLEHGAAFLDGSTFHCAGATAVEVFHAPGRLQRMDLEGLLYVENESYESEGTVVEGAILRDGATVNYALATFRNVVSLGPITGITAAMTIEASILTGAACALDTTGSLTTVRFSDLWDNVANACNNAPDATTMPTNVSVDPLFVSADDLHLAATSPLVDAGPDEAGYADPDLSRSDIGAYGGPFSLDGGW